MRRLLHKFTPVNRREIQKDPFFPEKPDANPEWAAKLAERSGEDVVSQVQQQQGLFLKDMRGTLSIQSVESTKRKQFSQQAKVVFSIPVVEHSN